MLRNAILLWKQERKNKGTPLQRRLFAFFILTATAMILLFAALLLVFGITGSGSRETFQFFQNEQNHIGDDITDSFGKLSLQAVAFAEQTTKNLLADLEENGASASELPLHPELLEKLLGTHIQAMTGMMERSLCSGVYILLDATVNPGAPDAAFSRAGVFLKKTDPSAVSAVGSEIHCLRGPAELARKNGIDLLGQWQMEFDIRGEEFWAEVMCTAQKHPDLPLSRLYYWSPRTTLKGNSESGLLLSVPLRDSDGSVFGVCGLEISDRLFKRQYSPDSSIYPGIFTVLAPTDSEGFLAERGLIAGNYYLTSACIPQPLTVSEGKNGFSMFQSIGAAYGGLYREIKLYPSDSPYSTERWGLGILLEEAALHTAVVGNAPYLLGIIVFLLIASMGLSIFISRRYLRPVTEGIDAIKSGRYGNLRSPYTEINDLMEYLAQQDEIQPGNPIPLSTQQGPHPMFESFLRDIETLSPAERSVFDLYLKGLHAQEIAEELCLSINTIKTHNRRIFAKLNVSTRKELLVYLDMMKKLDLIKEE